MIYKCTNGPTFPQQRIHIDLFRQTIPVYEVMPVPGTVINNEFSTSFDVHVSNDRIGRDVV